MTGMQAFLRAIPMNLYAILSIVMVFWPVSYTHLPKSEKLLKFQLDDGSGETRQILSGIAKYYQPEQLVGKTVVACTNLPPRKMMGQMSNGMLLSAEKDGVLNLVMLDDKVPAGAKLC